ncbi:MAG: WYL domain-containing protein [Demequinaceae bacterium]|nr:WYL domain-containing protein [Demequinaceae bacterium]
MPAPDAAERLLNLLIALTHARVRMTRAEIRATVAGYDPIDDRDDPETARKRTVAFERMFERDKEDLRRLGVPLRTVTDATHGDEIGYVIDAGDATMPPITLSAVERAVVAVAADYWQNAALGTDARRALIKITSSAARVEDETVHLAARSTVGVDAAPALAQAIADGQAVRFTYTSATSGKAERTVEPWRLVVRGGPLYLVGLDRDRGEPRTYRLSRIEGAVTAVGDRGAFVAPSGLAGIHLEAAVPTLTARIGLRAESGHAIRRRGRFLRSEGEWDIYDVSYCDTEYLRDEILGLAGAARVVSPETLAEAVVAHARAALEVAHA